MEPYKNSHSSTAIIMPQYYHLSTPKNSCLQLTYRLLIFLSCLFLFSTLKINAQDIDWNNTPRDGYVFKLSNDEAQRLIGKKTIKREIDENLLNNLVDTFNVNEGWNNYPDKGHFVLAKIIGNQLQCTYKGIIPYQVFLFREYGVFALQVIDLDGNIRKDAVVKLGWQNIRMDDISKTYRIENKWFHGENRIVSVELDGFRSFFDITQHKVPERNFYNNYDNGPEFYSYMITDKNKYKPGDLVRFKSYALTSTRSPIRCELELWMNTGRAYKKIKTITPHRPGSFASSFRLADSLNLTLDKHYYMQLKNKSGRVVASCQFRYEDYELNGNKLEVKLESYNQYFPSSNKLTISAIDENGLYLNDAYCQILIKPNNIREVFQPVVVMPDTLLFKEFKLDLNGPAEIDIPSDFFQKTNTSYSVIVKVYDGQNRVLNQYLSATHLYSEYKLESRFVNDSISFYMLKNGETIAGVKATVKSNLDKTDKEITLPYTVEINPVVSSYMLKTEFMNRLFNQQYRTPDIKIQGGIDEDTFRIQIENPQKLDITHYIYQGSSLIQKGSGDTLDFKRKINSRESTYYIDLLFSFGGKEHIRRRQYVFKESNLDIGLDIPDRIFPGQEVEARILVKSDDGKPVKGVDLTAFATTSKLNYNLPNLPYYGGSSTPRPRKEDYSKRDKQFYSRIMPLNYPYWNKLAKLDTMKYFQFTYPYNGKFLYSYAIEDSTQFAPFIMHNGKAMQVYVIEVDKKPVYYSWTSYPNEYSFYISPCKNHEITLRLHDRVIILDSINFERGTKNILSMDIDHLPQSTSTIELDNSFTGLEKERHKKYICSVDSRPENYIWLQSETGFTPLYNYYIRGYYRNKSTLVGPVAPGYLNFKNNTGYSIRYKHEGGYTYKYEDNVVYKLNLYNALPKYLQNNHSNPLKDINDLAMTLTRFQTVRNINRSIKNEWYPSNIDVLTRTSRMKINLPKEDWGMGVAGILFQNCVTKEIKSPCYANISTNQTNFASPPMGLNNVIVLYNNGTHQRIDSIPFTNFATTMIDFSLAMLQEANDSSRYWLNNIDKYSDECYSSNTVQRAITYRTMTAALPGNLRGVVRDPYGQPLPGATVLIKDTETGTVTDIDGQFSLDVDDYATLIVSFIGYITEEIEVNSQTDLSIQLVEDLTSLDEVVVIGYGTMRKSELTAAIASVKGEDISTVPEEDQAEEETPDDEKTAEEDLYNQLMNLKTIRSNFSDVGFWEPRLYSNKKGIATFKVVFPDDITRWDALVYGMNKRLQTGTCRKSIKSYKPLMAELAVPRFLTQGDSSYFTGKISNHTNDTSISGNSEWSEKDSSTVKPVNFNRVYVDHKEFIASTTDTIKATYLFTRDDGYMDGEKRTIPVIEQGTIRADGTLGILKNGDTKKIAAQSNEQITVEILNNQIDIYVQEARYLINYRYACNEQLASKLIGLINYKTAMEYKGKKFLYNVHVKAIIRKLLKNQNKEFLWSWWNRSSNTSYWMSAHILKALKCAKDAGYTVDLDIENIARKASYRFDYLKQISTWDAELINALASWDAPLDYAKYINKLELQINRIDSIQKDYIRHNRKHNHHWRYYYYRSYLKEKLLLLETRQKLNLGYDKEKLLKYKKEGVLMETYFSDELPQNLWYSNQLIANAVAYRIIKADSNLFDLKTPMQMYFLSKRGKGAWNTYHASNIVQSILPDMIAEGLNKDNVAQIKLSGYIDQTITKFPFKTELQPGGDITLEKQSGLPLYYMQYKKERVTEAKTGVEGFKIHTYFGEMSDSSSLEAGKPVNLVVEIELEKDLAVEYVMIDVPIPGSCSYYKKTRSYAGGEVHREYFKEKTSIFCRKIEPGKHKYVISLLPRFTGTYHINPAQVSLMYIPVVNANTDMKKVQVKERD